MKRQGLVMLAMAIVAAVASGCFSDPTSSLRSGPSFISLDHSVVFTQPGDSVGVVATLMDKQGNVLTATGATWASANGSLVFARKDTSVAIPGDYFTRGYVGGVAVGTTDVTVTIQGVSGTVKVTVQ